MYNFSTLNGQEFLPDYKNYANSKSITLLTLCKERNTLNIYIKITTLNIPKFTLYKISFKRKMPKSDLYKIIFCLVKLYKLSLYKYYFVEGKTAV